MKKSYLAPKSETLMAILSDLCQDTDPGSAGDPNPISGFHEI